MSELAVALTSVGGTLAGGALGSWLTSLFAHRSRMDERHFLERKERREAFAQAVELLLQYRGLELQRAHEVFEKGIEPGAAPTAVECRAIRRQCRHARLMLSLVMPDTTFPQAVSALIVEAQGIGHAASLALALAASDELTQRVDEVAASFARHNSRATP